MGKHAPKVLELSIIEVKDKDCILKLIWKLDSSFEASETPDEYHIMVGSKIYKVVAVDVFEAEVLAPRLKVSYPVPIGVCAYWDSGVADKPEEWCADAGDVQIPALPSTSGTNSNQSDIPTPSPGINQTIAHPRTLLRGPHIEIRWTTIPDCEYDYEYDSGRSDNVSDTTDNSAIDFDAAVSVAYNFRVRAQVKPALFIFYYKKASAWSPVTSITVPVQTSVKNFLIGVDASEGLGKLLRSKGFNPTSLAQIFFN